MKFESGSDSNRRRIVTAFGCAPYLVLALGVIAIPVAVLLSYSFREASFAGVGPGPTLDQYRDVIQSGSDIRIMLKTICVGLGVATLATTLAFILTYGARFRLSARAAAITIGVVVAAGVASFLVRIFAWGSILGANGVVNSLLQALHLTDEPSEFLYFGYFAIVVTMIYLYLPVATVVLFAGMQGVDPGCLDASRDLGMGRWRTITRVVVPQVRTALLTGFVLVSILASADFITPRLVGGTRGQMIGMVIRDQALTTGNYPRAAAIALVFGASLLAAVGGVLLAWKLLTPVRHRISRCVDWVAANSAAGSLHRVSTSLSRPAAFMLAAFLILPTIAVVVFSVNSARIVGLPIDGLTLDWYPRVVQRPGFEEALTNTLVLAGITVAGSLLIGIPYALSLRRVGTVASRMLWGASFVPFLVPGILIGIAVLTIASSSGIALGLIPTAGVHVLLASPIVILVVWARLAAMDESLTDAARDLGSSASRAFRTVLLPALLPSLVGAGLLAAAISLDEILVTTFSIGTETTIPIWLFGQARVGFDPGVNALGVMLLVTTATAFVIATAVARRFASPALGAPQ